MSHAPRPEPAERPAAGGNGHPRGAGVDVAALVAEMEGLQRALRTRPLIDLAKGMVMQRFGCDDAAAFGLLRRLSQEHNVKIRDLAAAIVARVDEQHGRDAPPETLLIATRLFDAAADDGWP